MASAIDAPPLPMTDSTPTRAPAGDAPAATVLVVDDEPRNLEVIRAFLEMEGLRVVTAEDGEGALAATAEHRPDVILLDVKMPAPDGYEVCRRLKDDPATTFIPVVILTALRGTAERTRGAAVGADEFLSKPFDQVELITRVRALVRSKRYYDQLLATNAALERRVAERTAELARALETLRGMDRMKSEIIANVSHELRTPLLHMKSFIDLLADGAMGALTPKQAEGLSVAREAIERLENIVVDIVDFNSLHEQRLALEPVYLPDVCRNVILAYSPAAARRLADVKLELVPEVPRVKADRVALTRVLRHLLDNAVKFGPLNQVVRLRLEPVGRSVRVTISDHGPGLAPEDLERVFEVFYQADGSATRRAGGLGLGLALVKKLVEAHGGQVRVESEPGRGSSFWFELEAVA
jgi:signal transduction histidine kinase